MKAMHKGLVAAGSVATLGVLIIGGMGLRGVFAARTLRPASSTPSTPPGLATQHGYSNPTALAAAVANASDASLPNPVAWVNGVAISSTAVAQAEVLVANAALTPMTTSQVQITALNSVIQQVVEAQDAAKQGLDPSVTQATSAYQQLMSNPTNAQIMMTTRGAQAQASQSNLNSPPSNWIASYQASRGAQQLLQKEVANVPPQQQSQATQTYIASLLAQAHVVLAPGAP